jgi:hypothetical protein
LGVESSMLCTPRIDKTKTMVVLFTFHGSPFGNGIFFEIELFIGFWEPSHVSIANHDIHSLLETPKHIVFDVWDTITLTDFLDQRSRFLITQHGKLWPHVMFNLIVQPPVHEIYKV